MTHWTRARNFDLGQKQKFRLISELVMASKIKEEKHEAVVYRPAVS